MNVKTWLMGKLTADVALMAAITDASHLLSAHPGIVKTFPALIYTEDGHMTTGYFDNAYSAIESVMTFDIYTAGTTTSTIFDALLSVMAAQMYNLEFSRDVPEADLNLRHKTCRFRRVLRAEDLV